MVSTITIENKERPGKRARLVWRPWWRGRTVVLLLEEQGEQGWCVRHRAVLKSREWGRGVTIARPWLGISADTAWVNKLAERNTGRAE